MRTEIINQIRGVLKTFGIVLGSEKGLDFEEQVDEVTRGGGMLNDTLRTLLSVLRHLGKQIDKLDSKAQAFAKKNRICRHLMSIPGVGAITAAAFVTTVDDPARFPNSKTVGAYFGLTPRRYQSGEQDRNGHISKCGDSLVRKYLFEAATALLTRVQKWSALKAWGLRIARRGSMKKAIVAVARKLAVTMHAMWTTGEEFRWSNTETAA
jgi:transposase